MSRWRTAARRVVAGLAITWGVVLLVVVALRIGYPLDLEWMEGGTLHHALRLQRGEPLYAPPSADFIPFLYTPLYPGVLALLGVVFPLDYPLGRGVSVAAWIAVMVALWFAVRWEGKDRVHAAAALGLFGSGYVFTFRWLDLARADTLFLALLAWGLVLLRHAGGSHRRAVWAGLLVGCAFWTKQTAAPFVIASGLAGLLVAPRQTFTYAAVIALVDGGGVLVGNAHTDGWLWTYIYELHQGHAFNRERFTTKTWGMFAHAAPFLVVAAGWLVPEAVRRVRRREAGRGGAAAIGYWCVLAATGLLTSALGYATQWAEPNAFVPGVFFTAMALGVLLPRGGRAETATLTLVAAQLLFGLAVEPRYQPIQSRGWTGLRHSYRWQDPGRTIPDRTRRAAAARMRNRLTSVDGEILALQHPWWNVLGGGAGHVSSMGLNDVRKGDRRLVQTDLVSRIEDGRYDTLVFEGEPPGWLRAVLARRYTLSTRLRGAERARPMTGYMSEAGMVTPYRADQLVFIRQAPRSLPPRGRVLADFEDGTLQGFETTGRAFGRRPLRGIVGKTPAVGPHGGSYLLSSAGSTHALTSKGVALSPIYEVPGPGRLSLWTGASGPHTDLKIEVTEPSGATAIAVPVPGVPYALRAVRVTLPKRLATTGFRVRITDADEQAAVFVDDLWWIPTS